MPGLVEIGRRIDHDRRRMSILNENITIASFRKIVKKIDGCGLQRGYSPEWCTSESEARKGFVYTNSKTYMYTEGDAY